MNESYLASSKLNDLDRAQNGTLRTSNSGLACGSDTSLTPASSATTDTVDQDFWLQNLHEAHAFSRWVVDEISPWLGQKMLEVGCGIGTYTVELAAGAREIVAIDMESTFIAEANRRLGQFSNVRVIYGDVPSMDLPQSAQGEFDTIILMDVLEHIEHDVDLLARLRPKLVRGGNLILKAPAMPSLFSPMDQAIGHWRRYDRMCLSDVIRRAGFELIDIWSFNAFAVPGWW